MHILVFFTYRNSLHTWYEHGLLARELQLYKSLTNCGVKFTFVTYGDDSDSQYLRDIPGIDVFPIFKNSKRIPKNRVLYFLRTLYFIVHAAELIRSTDLMKTKQLWGAWLPLMCAALFKKKLLLRTGYDLYQFTRNSSAGFIRTWCISLLTKVAAFQADRINVTTQQDKESLIKIYPRSMSKIEVIPNWVDTEQFHPKAKFKDTDVLVVGRLEPQKNIKQVLRVLSSRYSLHIVGRGSQENILKTLASSTQSNVKFTPSVPNDQLNDLMQSSRVFVLNSVYEGHPKVLLEAMSAGMAVIVASGFGVNGGVVFDKKNGLIVNGDDQNLYDAVEKLISDQPLARSYGTSARKCIELNFSLRSMIKKELCTYKFILEQSSE